MLTNHQHLANIVSSQKKLDGVEIAEEGFYVPVLKYSLQLIRSGRLKLQSVFGGDVVAVEGCICARVFSVEERKQDRTRFHANVNPLDDRLH